MTEPPPHAASTPAKTPRSHLAARFSIIASLICFTSNCLANQAAMRTQWTGAPGFAQFVAYVTMGIVIAGIGLGVVGLVGGIIRRSGDTIGVAVIAKTMGSL